MTLAQMTEEFTLVAVENNGKRSWKIHGIALVEVPGYALGSEVTCAYLIDRQGNERYLFTTRDGWTKN